MTQKSTEFLGGLKHRQETTPKRVLILTTAYLPQIGGSELAIKNTTDRLPGIHFDLITSRFSKNVSEYEQAGNVNIYRVGNSFSRLNFLLPKSFFPVAVFFKTCQLMRKFGPYNIIHAYQASQAAGGGWLLKWRYPAIPFIITIQEGKDLNQQPWLMKFFRYLIFKKADQATAISNYLARYVESQNQKLPVSVIPNGVDLEKFTNRESRIMNHGKVIITVSRLVEKNGIEDLIEAMTILVNDKSTTNGNWKMENPKLLIVGGGSLEKKLKLKVKNLKLESNIEFLGEISNELTLKYLSMADIFVRPSLSEGLGTAFLEAMAAGLPVIGTPVGGIPDFLKDGETGLFCNVGDPQDLAEKIKILLTDSELRIKLINNGRKLVQEKYNWDKIAVEFRKIYDGI